MPPVVLIRCLGDVPLPAADRGKHADAVAFTERKRSVMDDASVDDHQMNFVDRHAERCQRRVKRRRLAYFEVERLPGTTCGRIGSKRGV